MRWINKTEDMKCIQERLNENENVKMLEVISNDRKRIFQLSMKGKKVVRGVMIWKGAFFHMTDKIISEINA